MKFAYPVHFSEDADAPGTWNARIPGLGEKEDDAMTCGGNKEDCRQMASGLIDAWISIYLKENKEFPEPRLLPKGPEWEMIYPSLRMQFVCLTRAYRSKLGLSQTETAHRLGVNQAQYARLEDPTKANPTLATVQKVANALQIPVSLASK